MNRRWAWPLRAVCVVAERGAGSRSAGATLSRPMSLATSLLPLVVLIVLGAVLSRIRLLGAEFAADLNKLAAKALKAKLMGDSALAANLEKELAAMRDR